MKNPNVLLLTICLFWLVIGAKAQTEYAQKSYGIFVHYGWGGTEESEYGCQITQFADGTYPQSIDEAANNFDVQGFVDDVAAMSPEYLIFTAWHCGMNPLYPSAKMEEWLGEGHYSQRDVLQELLDACDAKGIDVYFYIQPSEAHDFSPEEQAAVGYINRNTQTETYNDFINEVIAELTERYKTQFKGYWFDKGLYYRCTDTDRIGETVRAIMPDAVLIANTFAGTSADFGAVEVMSVTANFEGEGYPGADKSDEETWPAFDRSVSFVSDRAWSSQAGSLRYTSEMMYRYTVLEAGVNEEGGGVAWALGPFPTTTVSWNNNVLSGMTDLGAMIDEVGESIKGTVPSDSWPTAEGTTIKDLDWGIATRSANGDYEYLHVLNAPTGTTLTIDAPDDGRTYTSAVNLRTGNSCEITQTASELTITLNPSDSWDPVDAVIKLSSDPVTTSGPAGPGDWSKMRLYGHAFKNEDFTDEQYDFIIKNMGIFTVEKRHARDIYGATNTEDAAEATAARIHAGNPDAKVLIYWSTNTAYTQFYTTVDSAISENPDWIDPSNSRYTYPDDCKDWWVEEANHIVNTRGMDGVFGDGAPGAQSRGYIDDVTDNLGALSELSTFNIYNGYRVATPTKIFAGSTTLANSNGVFIEAFFREPCDTKEEAEFLMDELLAVPSDKYIIARAASGVYGTTHDFSLACYLIAANDYSYYSWGGEGNSYAGDGTMTYWHSDFEQEIGKPLGVATKDGYAYSRVFEHCTVHVDFENSTSSIEWNQNNTNALKNLTIDATASQSSTEFDGDPSRAIDQNTNGSYADGSVTHTETENNAWWMATLDSTYELTSITVYNRTDANHIDRLRNFTIEVLDDNDQITFTETITSAPNPSVTIPIDEDVLGNRVRIIQNSASTPLSLAEVEVFGYSHFNDVITALGNETISPMFDVFPNPAHDNISVELGTTEHATYQILNFAGQVVLFGKISNGSATVDLSQLNSGVYGLRVTGDTIIESTKFVKN